jgi:hypothetical protein
MKVDIYWHSQRKLYSVRSRERGENYGRVIAHVEQAMICEPVGIVSDNGRRKVLAQRSKNVHAVIRGLWFGKTTNDCIDRLAELQVGGTRWFYNPYKQTEFMQGTALGPIDEPVSARRWSYAILDIVRETDRITPRVIACPTE